jgi:hypothetical protein
VFALSPKVDALLSFSAGTEGYMHGIFESWIGHAVVVQLSLGRIKLSVRGTLLKDLGESLLLTPEQGCDVEIPKTMVLAVEDGNPEQKFMSPFLYN